MYEALPVLDNICFAYSGSFKIYFSQCPPITKILETKNRQRYMFMDIWKVRRLTHAPLIHRHEEYLVSHRIHRRGSRHPFHSESTAKYSLMDS